MNKLAINKNVPAGGCQRGRGTALIVKAGWAYREVVVAELSWAFLRSERAAQAREFEHCLLLRLERRLSLLKGRLPPLRTGENGHYLVLWQSGLHDTYKLQNNDKTVNP